MADAGYRSGREAALDWLDGYRAGAFWFDGLSFNLWILGELKICI